MTKKISTQKRRRNRAKQPRLCDAVWGKNPPQTHSAVASTPNNAEATQAAPVPLSYPIGPNGSAAAFIQRASAVLSAPNTAVYIDTSFLMWLTKGGTQSRQQFFDWAATLGDRVHVPLWTYHEYYRHHNHNTLRSELEAEAKKLSDATKKYVDLARTYSDDPFKPGASATAFTRDLDDLVNRVREITRTTAGWDYERAASHVSEWMSTKLCRSKVVFDLMEKLGRLGETRYTQDLPPGFRDRTKEDEKNKGSNKFGDLILWEELIAHISSTGAENVVVLTRDRKDDWFARADAPIIEDELLRLLEKKRWNPVPAPHPTLVFELRERTGAVELLLLDSLYFGAVLHQTGNTALARLIAYSLGVQPTTYSARPPPPPQEVSVRPTSNALSRNVLRQLCLDITMSPSLDAVQSPHVANLRARLSGDVPTVEGFINQFDQQQASTLSPQDVAWFGRLTADDALISSKPMAQQMVAKLHKLLPILPLDRAEALFAGLLASAYFDEGGPRAVPKAWELQELFGHLSTSEYATVLEFMSDGLRAARSTALFLPSDASTQLKVRFVHDSRQEQTPLVLQQIAFGNRNLLTNVGVLGESNLRSLLNDTNSVVVNELLQLVASHYGLPLGRLEIVGAGPKDQRTLPTGLGFVAPADVQTEEAAAGIDSNDALEDDEDVLEDDVLEEDVLDEDKLATQAFLEDDSDDY